MSADDRFRFHARHNGRNDDGKESARRPDARPRAARNGWTGWLTGALCGVLIGLWAFPPVRYTLGAQLQFAFEDSVPWVRALESRGQAREAKRLDAAAARAPDDYLLQVGRATAFIEASGAHSSSRPPALPGDDRLRPDRTLFRLGLVARDFAAAPGGYAHFARYMMLDRVRIQRADLEPPARASKIDSSAASVPNVGASVNPSPLSPASSNPSAPAAVAPSPASRPAASENAAAPGIPAASPSASSALASSSLTRSIPAYRRDVRLMEWALQSGEKRDPTNAFWPAMLATTYFAALRDDDGLRALARAARKPSWDAYLYEEVLGQWRLYVAAYGDNGAIQKIGPLSLIAFPHLREIRRMGALARMRADREAQAGHWPQALRIRRNIASLGLRMRDSAAWAYEALYGTDLFFIGSADGDAREAHPAIGSVKDWERQAAGYLARLKRLRRMSDLAWLRREAETTCDLRARIDLARYDASYPGIPPGIPLAALFGDWMAGVCLLQQTLALAGAALLASLWLRRRPARRAPLLLALGVGTVVSGGILFTGEPSLSLAIVFLAASALLLTAILERLQSAWSRRDRVEEEVEVEARWRWQTTGALLILLLPPGLGALYLLRPFLSGLHPVALLLTTLMGDARPATATDALGLALLAIALPLAVILASAGWGLLRRVPPLTAALVGLRRVCLPALAGLALAYLLLLNRTLRLDLEASRAINLAAQNDLQWVLTHSADSPE